MSDKVKDRIEREAADYASQIYNREKDRLNWQNRRNGYMSGAEAERPKAWNEAIDEVLKLLPNYRGCFDTQENYNSLKYQIEALKHKQS